LDAVPPFSWSLLFLLVYLPAIFNGTGSGMIVPVLPIFAKEELLASDYVIGMMLAMNGFGQVAFNIPAGIVCRKLGIKASFCLGLLVVSGCGVTAYFASNVWVLGLACLMRGAGLCIYTLGRQSFVSAWIPSDRRGRALSGMGGVGRITSVVGPVIGGFVAERAGYRAVFLVQAGFATVGMLAVVACMPTTPPKQKDSSQTACCTTLHDHRWNLLTAGLYCLSVAIMRNSRNLLLPLQAHAIGSSIEQVGLVTSASFVTDASLFWTAGLLMDRWGRKAAALPSTLIMTISFFLLPFATTQYGLMVVGALFGVGNAMGSGLLMAIGSDLAAPLAARSEFLGVFRSITNSGALLGPMLTGGLAEISFAAASVMNGSVGLFGLVWCVVLVKETLVKSTTLHTESTPEVKFAPLSEPSANAEGQDKHEGFGVDIKKDVPGADPDVIAIVSPRSSIIHCL